LQIVEFAAESIGGIGGATLTPPVGRKKLFDAMHLAAETEGPL